MKTMRLAIVAAVAALAACGRAPKENDMKMTANKDATKLTDEDFKKKLTPEQYVVCRRGGTEPSGSGKYLHFNEPGTYRCAACDQPLFSSKTKYDACGWPSFWDCVPGSVTLKSDGFAVEAVCSKCESHLGHLFDDGPKPTGKRY